MPNTIPDRADHTSALQTYLAAETGLLVGDGKKPPGGGWEGAEGQSVFVAYLVVHSGNGGRLDGPMDDPHADAEWLWQVAGYSATQLGAEKAVGEARAALLVRHLPLVVADRTVTRVVEDISGGARQDPDQPSIFRAFANYRITTSPRSS